jgi:hypothetical protein
MRSDAERRSENLTALGLIGGLVGGIISELLKEETHEVNWSGGVLEYWETRSTSTPHFRETLRFMI